MGTGPSSGSAPRGPPAQRPPPPPAAADPAAGRPPPSPETPLGFRTVRIKGGSRVGIRAGLGRGGGLGLTGSGQVPPWHWKPWEDWSKEGEREVERGRGRGRKRDFVCEISRGFGNRSAERQNRYRVCRSGQGKNEISLAVLGSREV